MFSNPWCSHGLREAGQTRIRGQGQELTGRDAARRIRGGKSAKNHEIQGMPGFLCTFQVSFQVPRRCRLLVRPYRAFAKVPSTVARMDGGDSLAYPSSIYVSSILGATSFAPIDVQGWLAGRLGRSRLDEFFRGSRCGIAFWRFVRLPSAIAKSWKIGSFCVHPRSIHLQFGRLGRLCGRSVVVDACH